MICFEKSMNSRALKTKSCKKVEVKNGKKGQVGPVNWIYIWPSTPNIKWRDVQTKNVVNNVDMSCLRAQWQNDPYKN